MTSVIINSVAVERESSSTLPTPDQGGSSASGLYAVGTPPPDTETGALLETLEGVIEAQARVSPPEERAAGLIRGLMFILNHHGAPKDVCHSFRTQASAYLTVESEAVFFKRAKYLTVAPMAWYLRCDAPKPPDVAFHPSGHWKRWSHSRRVFTRRNTHLWYSFLQGKRAALPLSDELVLTTYEEHRVAMGLVDPITETTYHLVMKELEPVLDKIRRTLLATYGGARLTLEDEIARGSESVRETRRVASTRACFEASRAKGGQLGYLQRLSPVLSSMNPENHYSNRRLPDLRRIVFLPIAVVGGRVRTNVTVEEYYYPDGERTWTDSIMKESLKFVGGVRLSATIQAVLEPLKVRVISKGNAVPYYVSQPLQKALHDCMREMPCFRLIGRPLCPTDLIDLFQNRSILGKGQYEWFSIDYSAATDRLSARLSAGIMESLLKCHDSRIRELWMSVLAPHKCRYPFPFSETVKQIDQVNGQLMGSILSFPILCLANLGLYLANIAEDSRPLREKLAGVLVNGDDMLYVGKQSLWKNHVELGNSVGLVMSPGKAYHHPTYANANSACFHYPLKDVRATPWSIPFLNAGLYFGQHKVLGGDDVEATESKCAVINRLLAGALPGKAPDVLAGYLAKHSKGIQNECRGRNLFIPCSLGGMGVDPPVGWSFSITAEQQYQAARIVAQEPYGHFGGEPRPGYEVTDAPVELAAPWLAIHELEREPYRARSYWGKYANASMVSKPMILQQFLACDVRRETSLCEQSGPIQSDPFTKRYNRDRLFESGIALDPVGPPTTPWAAVARSLEFDLEFGTDWISV